MCHIMLYLVLLSGLWSSLVDSRFKRFHQKCELLLDGSLKSRHSTQKCKDVLLWSGDYGLDLFNTWVLSNEQQKDLEEYWILKITSSYKQTIP